MSQNTSNAQNDSQDTRALAKDDKQNSEERSHGRGSTSATDTKRTVGPGLASPSAISTALLVSSCTKLFPILLVIWPESTSGDSNDIGLTQSFANRARSYVGWAVLLNNIEALLIMLDCGYFMAAGLALSGTTARWAVEGAVLAIAGLDGESGPVGDIIGVMINAFSMLPGRNI